MKQIKRNYFSFSKELGELVGDASRGKQSPSKLALRIAIQNEIEVGEIMKKGYLPSHLARRRKAVNCFEMLLTSIVDLDEGVA